MKPSFNRIFYLVLFIPHIATSVFGQGLNDFTQHNNLDSIINKATHNSIQFNGYTNYWHDTYRDWYRYGNLYKISVPDVEKNILQGKVDVAEDMGMSGLVLQEGFIDGLLASPYQEMQQPTLEKLEEVLPNNNILAFVDPKSPTGKKLMDKLGSGQSWPNALKSHQYSDPDISIVNAFYLEHDDRKLFVVSSSDEGSREQLRQLINDAKTTLQTYDLHKGWFGAQSLLKSVTCTDGHPLETIGRGMNEGNSWFVFSGYMDFLAKNELETWMKQVNLPIVTDVGFGQIYGCEDYDGLQVQSMFTKESWIDYAHSKNGYVFRQVWDTLADPLHYDGYFANEGNKEQIDKEDVPFVLQTGNLDGNALNSMVLFTEKGQPFTKENMWKSITNRKAVGILERGKMMGPASLRNVLQLLLLDKSYLESYFGDHINIETSVEGYELQVNITNTYAHAVSGKLELTLPASLSLKGKSTLTLNLPKNGTKSLLFPLIPGKEAMDNTNPIGIAYSWEGQTKHTVAMLDLPPAISVHRLLYAHAPEVDYPVTIHNFTNKSSFPVKVEVMDEKNKVVFKTGQTCEISMGNFRDLDFKLKVPAGNYKVKVSAAGVDYVSQLGVGKAEGKPHVYAMDLNSDGVDEYRMENDSVQVTLLATGARVIEYIVKSRNDNVLFKLWPKKAIDDKRPFRKRGYYPYGGFEDFLGQGSMETHQVYDAEITHKEGDFVRVKMWTDYYGNRLQKTFTLYGNSPLLEVRFALTFKNPEANVLGPQPILSLGKKHWTEDVFTIPELDGTHEYRMMPERYFGRLFFLKEGWNAGYDSKEDVTFVGAFPVDQPLFLHMWMNHPRNGDAHHYYAEFQPWTPIYQKSTMYFTYYLWGAGGPWENGVDALRNMNLISNR